MDQTKALILKAQEGVDEAKEQLLEENSGLIRIVVKRFHGRGYDDEDLFQIGAIGLLKAIERFDLSYDVKFSTYAVPMILGEIRRFLRDDGMLKVSRTLKETAMHAKRAAEEFYQRNGRESSLEETAQCIGVTKEELLMALEAGRQVESLSAPIGTGEDKSFTLAEKIPAAKEENDFMLEKISLQEALQKLGKRERQIIFMRYFEDQTQSAVAKQMGISQVQVSRIEKKVLLRMKEEMKEG